MSQSLELIKIWESNKHNVRKKERMLSAMQSLPKNGETIQRIDKAHSDVFSKIDCLDCANCCKSIPPIVLKNDARRIAKFLKVSISEFYEKYTQTDEDGDKVLSESPCIFLDENNACKIYDVRPKACRKYPHTEAQEFINHSNLLAQNINYCPAAYSIVSNIFDSLD